MRELLWILGERFHFRFIDLINSIEKQLKQLSKFPGIDLEFQLVDNYTGGGPIPIDVGAHFAWRSPEIESFVINFKQRSLPDQFWSINCDFLHSNFVIEEIAEDSGILNEKQLIILKDDGYWYWSFSIVENEIDQGYIDLFIKSVLQLNFNDPVPFCISIPAKLELDLSFEKWEQHTSPNGFSTNMKQSFRIRSMA